MLRDDIEPENTFVISDTHFGHTNIIGYCKRPDDHEQIMMESWASQVPDDATVLHLGDLCWKGGGMFKHVIAKHLTGNRKLLLRGNHDKQRYSFFRQAGFALVRDFEIRYRGYTISFSHYPWNNGPIPNKTIRVHGHIHNQGYSRRNYTPYLRNHINVSAEMVLYKPCNLKTLLDAYLFGEYEPDPRDRPKKSPASRDMPKHAGPCSVEDSNL